MKILKTGGDEAYTVDSLSNRYSAVGGTSQAYDAAGNLAVDADGYGYSYDYESRIVEINDADANTIVQYAYDALGRRIKRYDAVADETRYYYNNPRWQVLEEYVDGLADNNLDRYHIYGNGIDEVLFAYDCSVGAGTLYVHDHLDSPAALIHWNSTTNPVVERYEYDAYGNVNIMAPDYTARTISLYQNETLFTGRTLDTLDNGDFKIMYYRNRYYNPNTGRFLINDPLGITPNPQSPNKFNIPNQYTDGLSLYEYVNSQPIKHADTYGLFPPWHLPDLPPNPPFGPSPLDNIIAALESICDNYTCYTCCKVGVMGYDSKAKTKCKQEARIMAKQYYNKLNNWVTERNKNPEDKCFPFPGNYNSCDEYAPAIIGFGLGSEWLGVRQGETRAFFSLFAHTFVGVFHKCNKTETSDAVLDPWSFGDPKKKPVVGPGVKPYKWW
jgi:RHS repeat-associated protein